ncbi:MAG: DUF4912 domain-containing protein [Gammaproteobacteria bacterium]|nr:DUF4912 domain-containing protein [Gammaproteobacteria bacterium]
MTEEPNREKRHYVSDSRSPNAAATHRQTAPDDETAATEQPAAVPTTNSASSGDFAPEELRAISQDLAEKFPIPIETTELVLMDVDPHHVHAYWNITPADLAAARTNADHLADETALVLRLNDLSPGPPNGAPPHEPIDIAVHGLENHWHVDLWQDAKSYMAELGLRTPDGRLALLARSNPVEMPAAGRSAEHSSAPADQSWAAASPTIDAGPDRGGDVRAAGFAPDPTLAGEPGNPLPPVFPNTDGSGKPAPATGAGADDIPTLPANPRSALPPVRGHGPVLTGSPSQLPNQVGAGPKVSAETYSSSSLTRSSADLELQAELHIYGRGTPGGRIELFGQQIALGPDGGFSFRRPLSDPWIVLSMLATKPDDTGAQGGDG